MSPRLLLVWFMDKVGSNSSFPYKHNHTTTFIVFTPYTITTCSLWPDGVLICVIVTFILAGRICFFLPSEKTNNNDGTAISINWPLFFRDYPTKYSNHYLKVRMKNQVLFLLLTRVPLTYRKYVADFVGSAILHHQSIVCNVGGRLLCPLPR